GRHRRRHPPLPQYMRRVAEETLALGPLQRGPCELVAPDGRVELQPRDQVGLAPVGPRRERAESSGRGLAVPGTDVLADVAAEDPAVQVLRGLILEGPPMLDRPVADALPRVELIRTHEGSGRAGIEASGAGPTVVRRVRTVIGQLQVG